MRGVRCSAVEGPVNGRIQKPVSLITAHPLISIFLTALALRGANILYLWISGGGFVIEDSFFLWFSAEWARAFGLMEGEPARIAYVERVPFYPLVVALLQGLGLGAPALLALVNGVFDSVTCVVVGLLGCRLDRRLGLAAGLLAACWPNLIIHSGLVLNDALFVLLFAGLLYWAAKFLAKPGLKPALLAGLLLGLAVITRPVAQFLVPALAVAAFGVALCHGLAKRHAVILAAVLVLPVALAVAPLLAHNHSKFGSWALSAQSGTHLAYWVLAPVKRAGTGAPYAKSVAEIRAAYELELERHGLEDPHPFAASRVLTSVALAELRASSPLAIAKAWAKGMAVNLASPAVLIDTRVRALATQSFYALEAPSFAAKVWRYVSGNGPLYTVLFVLGAVGSIVTLALAGYGFLSLWRRQPWAAAFAALAVLYFLLVNGPVASPKYRLPIEPIMVLLTAMGGLGLWDRLRPQKGSVG